MARPILYPTAEELIRNKKKLKLHARIEEEDRRSGSKRGGNIEPQ
jgi:hypothetical protein